MKNKPPSEETEKPDTPVTDLIKNHPELCGIAYGHAIFKIEEYVKRNDVAHSGIDILIANRD